MHTLKNLQSFQSSGQCRRTTERSDGSLCKKLEKRLEVEKGEENRGEEEERREVEKKKGFTVVAPNSGGLSVAMDGGFGQRRMEGGKVAWGACR